MSAGVAASGSSDGRETLLVVVVGGGAPSPSRAAPSCSSASATAARIHADPRSHGALMKAVQAANTLSQDTAKQLAALASTCHCQHVDQLDRRLLAAQATVDVHTRAHRPAAGSTPTQGSWGRRKPTCKDGDCKDDDCDDGNATGGSDHGGHAG